MLLSLVRTLLLAAVALGLLVASDAGATAIGPNCGTCQGSIYDLTYAPAPVATTATTETWRITLTIDTSGYDGSGVYLNTVAIKVAADFLAASLISAPGSLADWVEMSGGLNAAGCSGSGSGFDCVAFRAAIDVAPAVPGATYAWVFDIEVAGGDLFTGTDEASVKARYVSGTGLKVGALVSENITLSTYMTPHVPEPAAATLLVVAAVSLEITRRRGARGPS